MSYLKLGMTSTAFRVMLLRSSGSSVTWGMKTNAHHRPSSQTLKETLTLPLTTQ